jgi:hypothetical protein
MTYTCKPVYFQTGANSFWSPCTEFLISMRNQGYAHFTPGPGLDYAIAFSGCIPKRSPDIPMSPSPSCGHLWSNSDGGMLTLESWDEEGWFEVDPEEEIPKHGPCRITSPFGML